MGSWMTHLDDTLEVHVHRVRELEGLEVRIGDDGGGRPKVLYLLEMTHDLRPGDAPVLIHQLDRRPPPVVCHAVPHEHVELVLVVLDGKDHGHRLTDLHDP